MTSETECFLGLDQGSGATKAVVLSPDGATLFSTGCKVATVDFGDGRVEQNLTELKESLESVTREAQSFAETEGLTIKCGGVALQRSGTCAWGSDGVPVTPLLSWRDTRAKASIDELSPHHSAITAKTGLPINAHYAASKWALLRKNYPDLAIKVGTLDCFLRHSWRGSPLFAIEETMAARTLLYSLSDGDWDRDLCNLFGVSIDLLPSIVPSISSHGSICGVPITACIGDQQAALHGRAGDLSIPVLNLGTIGSLSFASADLSCAPKGFIRSLLRSESTENSRNRLFMIEGTTNSFGPLFSLLFASTPELSTLEAIDGACQRSTTPPVGFFPLGGTATPFWRQDLPLVISESTTPTRDDLVRAIVEHLAYSVAAQCLLLQEAGISFGSGIAVGGGYSQCQTFLQTLASATGLTIFVYGDKEITARGAAILAAHSGGQGCFVQDSVEKRVVPRATSESGLRFSGWMALRDRVLRGNFESRDRQIDIRLALQD